MSISRYWRLVGFRVTGSGPLELSEARIYEGGMLADAAASISVTIAPTSGSLSDLRDGLATGIVAWVQGVHTQPGFALQWDFGVGAGVETPFLQLGAGNSTGTFPADLVLQNSVDNIVWNTYQGVTGVTYPGDMSLTDTTAPVATVSAKHIRLVCLSAQTPSNYYRVGEVEVSLLSGGANLCIGGTASGNGDYYPSSNAFDGASNGTGSSGWAGSPGVGRTLQYDFGALKEFSYLRVINGGPTGAELAQTLKDYDIETSVNGTTWNKLAEVRGRPSSSDLVTEHALSTPRILPATVGLSPASRLQPMPVVISDSGIGDAVVHGHKSAYVFVDVYNGGIGVVAGTVKEKNTPANTPLRRRVMLVDEASRMTIRETWSDPVTGAFEFRGVKQGVRYSTISYDHLHNYRAVIADNQDAA